MKHTGGSPSLHSRPARPRSYRLSSVLMAAASIAALPAAETEPGPAPVPGPTEEAPVAEAAAKKPSLYDRIWSYTDLYKNPDNPIVQNVHFAGRYQLDFAVLDSADFQEFNNRRWRMGAKIQLLHQFTVHAEVDLDHDEDPYYQRLTDAYIGWSPNPKVDLKIGKHSAPFTMDGQTSSKELLTIDRSNLANNLWFPDEYIPGVSVAGDVDHWLYQLGVYSAGSASPEFGNFDGSFFILSTVGYDFSKKLGAKEAVLRANYVYQEVDPLNEFTRPLRHVGSVNFAYANDHWGVRTDLSGGLGYLGQSDLWGFMIMPFYNLTKNLQAVARYTYLKSNDDNGVRFARYETEVAPGRGDEYLEYYLGLNYYFYGHKLKIQSGVQYADMNDHADDGGNYRGWAWVTGLRIGW